MNGVVSSLRLGWKALLFQEDAYEEMRTADNPVVKGLILIVVVGVVIALLGLVGTTLEWASMPDLNELRDTILHYIPLMPWWDEVVRDVPDFQQVFQEWYDRSWQWFPRLFGAPNLGGAALDIITTPLGLVIRWLIYGLLAYLFARWLGGTADLSETLGVLALAVAPQALNVLGLLPFVELGSLVSIWGLLCAYVGLKTAHKLSWTRAVWAALLPFILALVVLILEGCLGTAILGIVVKGG
jgi:ABC-type glycerol-3-phosphate transport system permease component